MHGEIHLLVRLRTPKNVTLKQGTLEKAINSATNKAILIKLFL